MPRKMYQPEEIIRKLREAEVLSGQVYPFLALTEALMGDPDDRRQLRTP